VDVDVEIEVLLRFEWNNVIGDGVFIGDKEMFI
jgi:hypothetical protein